MKNLIFKSSFHEKLKMLLIAVGLLVTSLTTQMWGWNSWSSKTIYFDNSYWASDGYTPQLLIGRYYTYGSDSRGSSAETMTNISGTDLWYLSSYSYSNYTNEYFISNSSTWPNEYGCNYDGCSNCPESRVTYAAHYTNSYNTNGDNTYNLFVPASASNNASLTYTSNSSYSTLLNSTQRIYQCVSENGGTPAKSTASIGTISISTKYLSSATAASNASGSISSGSNTVYKSAARTATVTMTATSIADGYTFLGWYSAETGGTRLESSTTYTYKASAAKTVYARFSHETTHTVNITYVCASPSATVATATSQAIGQVTASSITAPTVEGYTFSSWTLGSGMSNQSASTSVNPISVKTLGSGNYTMQANYTEDITSHWHLVGNSSDFPDGWNVNNTTMMQKKTGYSTDKSVYFTVNVTSTDTKEFKVVDDNGSGSDIYYGYSTGGTYLTWTATSTKSVYTGSGNANNLKYTPTVAGPYEFKVDYSGTYPAVTITYPTAYTLTYSIGSVAGNNGSISTSPTTASGSKVLSGNTVTLTGPAAKTGYAWKGWYTNAAGTEGKVTDTNRAITVTMNDDKTLYACYTENDYTVTVNAGTGGSVASGSVTGHVSTNVTLPTATADVGYYFTGWTVTTGTATLTSASSATAAKINGMTDAVTVRANFAPIWYLKGDFNSWGETLPLTLTSATSGSVTLTTTSAKLSNSKFKIWNKQTNTYYQKASQSITRAANTASGGWTNGGTSNDMKFNSDVIGNYTFAVTFSSNIPSALTVTYPTAFTVTFGKGTGGSTITASATSAGGSFSSGDYVASGDDVTFTQTASSTGYTFSGWYTTKDTGGSAVTGMGVSDNVLENVTSNKTVWSRYSANTYTITLTRAGETGYGSGGTASVTATYNATLPTISTLPTAANGYGFMGYFTDHNGEGTQYYGADGSKLVSKYTTVGPLTLYAYFKRAEITSLTFKNNNVVTSPPVFPADANKITVTANLEPTPAGSTHIDWRMLHGNDNPLDDQPSFGTGTTTNQFALPAGASGTYKIEAVLRMGATAGEGTTLSTMVVSFQVAAEHTVTVLYKCGDETIKSSSTVTGKPLEWTEVVAHKIVGYSFDSWTAGDGITLRDTTAARLAQLQAADPTIVAVKRMKAIYDGKLTINYTPKRMIYFYNTLNWSDVYVYFYKNDSYWGSSNQGSGANTSWQLTNYPYGEGKHGKMSPVEPGSKIYYFDADSAGVNESYTNVVFTELNQHGCDYFYNNNKVVRRGDYHATTMPLFVPLSDQPEVKKNGNTASYYCEGYWMNYPANTGYTLRIYDTWNADNVTGASREFLIPFSEDVKMPLKQEVEINFSGKSWFLIYRNDGKYLEGSHTFKQTDHGDKKITKAANAGSAKKMILLSDGSGIYTFNLSFRGDGGSPENYDYYLSVDFPAAVGDYRIVYKDNATWSNGAHGASWYHPSDIISKNKSETEAKEDIVSFFVSHGSSPSMKFQYISAINGSTGAITWTDVPSGSITIPASITKSGVYNFIVSQPAGGASISLEKAEPYTGNYYIRTDCAGETKWNNFRSPDHLMSYSEYSITHGGYSHYYTHWVQTTDKKNIQFCIANDYSSAISDTLIRESNSVPGWENINTYINSDGDILRNANVRFMWNQSTNKVSRAYVDGAQGVGSNNFLYILSEDSKIRNADESSLVNNKVQFSDKENWIYEAYIQAKPNAAIKLLSNWGESNTITQYFKGSSSSTENLIGGSGSDFNTIRVLYDFKTNRLIAALVPTSGNYESDNAIEADIMFIREHQGDVAQLTFGDAGKISKIETAYGVMRFNKWTMNNKSKEEGHSPLESPASVYERSLFWISFPFKVKLSEVFGFGTYGEHWAVQRYDGTDRAARGHFQENGSFWKWMNRSTEYLEPNQGYLLAIDADLLTEDGGMWPNNIQNLELFFPSYGTMPDITSADVSQTIPTHTCEIDWATTKGLPRTNDPRTSYDRTIFDSHWNVISVPTYVNTDDVTFANTTWTAAGKMGPKFLYTWNADDNTITATTASGYTYHAMHAYMTQYCGGITWSAKSGSPASVVARRAYMDEPKEIEFNLELQQNEKTIDRAFVVLSADEDVSAGFQFGEDMTKEFNASRSAIYTFIPDVAAVAGNTLPMSDQTTVVPVGVDIIAEGEYIISLPEGTSGVGVTLIDNELQTRTNLALTDYAVTLPAGTYDERFVIEISPIEQISTNVETVTGDGLQVNGVCKKLIDGVLYIVKDGKVFDARGARVQ